MSRAVLAPAVPIVVGTVGYMAPEQVRAEPTHFLVVPGHELPEVETVVRREDRFWVVRKDAGEPEELAIETDPRR